MRKRKWGGHLLNSGIIAEKHPDLFEEIMIRKSEMKPPQIKNEILSIQRSDNDPGSS